MNEQREGQEHNIRPHIKWPECPREFGYVKTPTHMLYCPDDSIAWGHEARKKIMNAEGYYFFEKFKMKLYNQEEFYENKGKCDSFAVNPGTQSVNNQR
jgi:hypothetical protein